ncbi:DUF7289 family protein [Natrinema salifodinae]|uniref:Uncharacterized protein n=1 Tax=Natrinema salifodinae TaxID=1202768 RepID=A0A1I0N8E3_9EURY|nr:hypothetical protein [Natrinema salifodinae]SEV97238.1 hypothetical protein SAMN05216285_1429 [Natrinema salifodinae]
MRRSRPWKTTRARSDDRAVSDVLAFILVFAIILGSVALLSTTGFQAMNDYQEGEQLRNAERAMEALAVNFNDVIRYNGVEQRYGELSLRDGTVSTGDTGTELNITITDSGTSETIGITDDRFTGYGDETTADLGEFTYTTNGNRIAYEGGGLARGDESESWSTALKRPQIRCGDDVAVISLVTISADDRSIQSSGGLGVTMTVENRSSKVYTGADDVSITVENSTYEDAWNATLESGTWGSDTPGTCEFEHDSGRVVVTLVDADLEY